jgi:hypothetical protein
MHNFSPLYYLYLPTCKLCMFWKIIEIINENARNITHKKYYNVLHLFYHTGFNIGYLNPPKRTSILMT